MHPNFDFILFTKRTVYLCSTSGTYIHGLHYFNYPFWYTNNTKSPPQYLSRHSIRAFWVILCQVIQAWTWPISEFDKNLPSCYNIWYNNYENFSLISCMDQEKSLFKVSKVRLKTPKLGVQSKFIWFLELYISGSTNFRKVIFYRLKPL